MTAPGYHGNCFIWAFTQWATVGGHFRVVFPANGGPIPRFLWSWDGEHWYYFRPTKPRQYRTLPRWRKIFAIHVLWYQGEIAVHKDTEK